MLELHASAIWGFGIVQFLGWMGGLLVRCHAHGSCGRRRQSVCHAFFVLALLAVGVATCVAFFAGAHLWLLSATTLACMILLAICDFDRTRRPATI
jgi:hypothetical protein